MARFSKGWIKTPRDVADTDQQNNPLHGRGIEFALYIKLCLWANYKDGKSVLGRQDVTVLRGEVITSYSELTGALGFSKQNLRTALANLIKIEKINMLSNKGGLHLSICNYNEIQDFDYSPNTATNPTLTRPQHDANTGLTRPQHHSKESNNQERKEGNKETEFAEDSTPQKNNLKLLRTVDDESSEIPGELQTIKSTIGRTQKVVEAYARAYLTVHHVEPKDNQILRSAALRLIKHLGDEDAPQVAEWYVLKELGRDGWLLSQRHPFGELVQNYQTYYANWKAGAKISPSMARAYNLSQANAEVIDSYLAMKHGSERGAT